MSEQTDRIDEAAAWRELFIAVLIGESPILPRPRWPMEPAFVAFVLDARPEATAAEEWAGFAKAYLNAQQLMPREDRE